MIELRLNENNIEQDIEYLFNYYKANGFPNYDKSKYNIEKEIIKLKKSPNCINNETKVISQSMIGCGILWTYFPHWIDIRCNGSQSVSEVWADDNKLKTLIRKTYIWKLKHNEPNWTENRIRQISKVYGAKQAVSNFRPTVARDIYNKYGGKDAKVLDMCSGFGGRMLGFAASQCAEYAGTDPSAKTYEGLLELSSDIKSVLPQKKITVYDMPFEDLSLPSNYFDVAFTSPPYFNTEIYSDEENNSCNRYPEYNQWVHEFLEKIIYNAMDSVKQSGYVIINIANVKNAPNLSDDCFKIMERKMKHIDTYKLVLSSIAGKGIKYEYIYVFQK